MDTFQDIEQLISERAQNHLPFKNYKIVEKLFQEFLDTKEMNFSHLFKKWQEFVRDNYPCNGNKNINYYLVRGYTEDQALKEVTKIQQEVASNCDLNTIEKRVKSWKKNKNPYKTIRGRNFYKEWKGLSDEETEKIIQTRNEKWFDSLDLYIETTGDNFHKRKGLKFEELVEIYGEKKAKKILHKKGEPFLNGVLKHNGRDNFLKYMEERRFSRKNIFNKYDKETAIKILENVAKKRESKQKGPSSKIENLYYKNELNHEWKRQLILKGGDGRVSIYDFYNPETKEIIEFQGDYWHCNPEKYKNSFYHPMKKMTAEEIWEYDENKKNLAIDNGYIISYIWEKDYMEELKTRIESIHE